LYRFRFPTAISLAVLFILLLGACHSTSTPIKAAPNWPTLTELPQGWTKIEPGGDTRCAHDTPYAFWVRPGTTNKVFVYFQGGGGCYNAETCGLTGSYKEAVTDNDNPDYTIGGVFNLDHPENPFRDDTMVFVPYCTGDVHAGNRVETYTTNAGRTFDIYHRGYVNARTALNWLYANVEQPDSIFVAGCSAGSIGSMLHTPHIIQHYPHTPVIQLGDSGGGLTSYIPWDIDADYDAGQYFPDWISGMQEDIAHSFTLSTFTIAVANYYPTYIFSQYNSANDSTQSRYFVADGGSEEDFATALQTSLNEVHQNSDNFRSYTAQGERHCILKYANFYAEETDGIRFRDWVANLANQIEVESVNCTAC
jgi:hypothetical protein